jgi:hypothetical protein
MNDSLTVFFEEKPKRDDLDFIRKNLREFNRSRVGYADSEPLNYFLRDENSLLVGGLLAETYWQCLYVNILWLEEKLESKL